MCIHVQFFLLFQKFKEMDDHNDDETTLEVTPAEEMDRIIDQLGFGFSTLCYLFVATIGE